MKDICSKVILVVLDVLAIVLAIILAYKLRIMLNNTLLLTVTHEVKLYLSFPLLYIVPLVMLAYEGVYTIRRDFWQESRIVIKSLLISLVIIFAILAMTKDITLFSRLVIIFSLGFMAFLIPLFKNIGKKALYKVGLWRRSARVYGCDILVRKEVFHNHYLGYVDAKDEEAETIFINAKDTPATDRNHLIGLALASHHEVVFIPAMDEFDLTKSNIDKLQNTQTNLIYFRNRLVSPIRKMLKRLSDVGMLVIALPLLSPLLAYIAYKIRKEDPSGPVLFKQKRMGKDNKVFVCYKFRSMHTNGDVILQEYLASHPEEVSNYEKFHKYDNDPRITRIGDVLRRTSLDELPQIFNILKGEMSFIGPRPYMLNEEEKIGKNLSTVLTVKPGITGLWQVSGRSEVDFMERVDLDVWYIRNWSLWLDIVILFKTIKTVLYRDGAS